MNSPMLAVENLAVRFGDTVVLEGLSLSVRAGESVAVMGPSGSGKTSLLGCVTGTMRPTAGRVWLGDVVVSELGPSARSEVRRRCMGLVFQNPDLLPELTVAENVAITLLFDGQRRRDALAAAREVLGMVGLAERSEGRVDELSGGQAQRVAVARALVRPSLQLLVADEPTAALDAGNARHVTGLLLERCREVGAAALVATHDQAVAAACDRVLDLREILTATGGGR